jgi:tRNA dimethylallyltransferase
LNVAGEGFEIISVDSVQVYRLLDIGSGKPDQEQLQRIRHYLIDIVDPDYRFTAGDFVRMAREAAVEISSKGKIPLFVGGTGLYLDSFFKGLSHIPPVENSVRLKLYEEMEERGLIALHRELMEVDPEFAEKVHPNDPQRIIRGLEVYRETGRSLSCFYKSREGAESEQTLYIGISPEKSELHRRIELRVDSMMEKGFVDEVVKLRGMGYTPDLPSMKSIGYAEVGEYLDKIITYNESVEKIKSMTKKFAKRQITWFKRNKKIVWFNPEDEKKITKEIENWLN